MQHPRIEPEQPVSGRDSGRPTSIDRRRLLLRGGSVAAPVLATLVSQPVSATGLVGCTKASGFVSMNTFASQQRILASESRYINCTSHGLSFWNSQAVAWNNAKATHQYRNQLAKTVANFFGVSSCTSGTSIAGDILRGTIQNSGSTAVLQRLLALGCSLSYSMVPSPNNFSRVYLGEIWINFNANGQIYKPSNTNETMTAAQLITWLNLLTTATPVVNSAP